MEITNDVGTTVYGSVTNPASDTPSITLSTNTLTATTTSTQYKIRITPKSHAAMPVPPGSTYSVTAKINSWTGTNTAAGSDTAGTTITIDNLSPGNVTAASGTAGNGQVVFTWTNPVDADFNSTVVLRSTTGAVTDTPVEGTTYTVGNIIGSSTVVSVTSRPRHLPTPVHQRHRLRLQDFYKRHQRQLLRHGAWCPRVRRIHPLVPAAIPWPLAIGIPV